MLAQNVVGRGCSLLTQLALAALLRPADFGVIGLTYTVTTIAAALTNIGMDDVLLQRRQGLRLWTGPAFWIGCGLALASGLLVVAVSPFAASVYKAPDLVGLLAILALSMPLNALSNVPGMIMRARMQFGIVAAYGTLELVALSLMTIGLAWDGFGVYSFVIPAPILAVVRAVAWWRLAATKTGFRPQPRRWKYVVGNTAVNFASRTIITLIGQGDYVVLGLLATQEVVGGYYFAFRLAVQPLWMLAGNFSGVLFPALVQLKGDPRRQGLAALKAATLLSYCVMPLALVQAAVAEPLVGSFFGQKWVSAIPIIQLLSIGLALDAVSWVAGALLSARGEFVAGLRYVLMQAPAFFVLVVAGALLGEAQGVAWGVCLYYATTQPLFVWGVFRRLGITARQVASIYLQPSLYAVAAVGTGMAISMSPPFAGHPLVRVAAIGVVAPALYAVLVRWLAADVWRELTGRLAGAVRRRVAA